MYKFEAWVVGQVYILIRCDGVGDMQLSDGAYIIYYIVSIQKWQN